MARGPAKHITNVHRASPAAMQLVPRPPRFLVLTSVDHFKNVTRRRFQSDRKCFNTIIIDALTSTIPANDVISASRISNGRIAVYFNSKEAVIKAVQHGLEFGGSFHE